MNETGRFAAWWERLRTVPGLGRDTAALVVMVLVGLGALVGIKSYLGGGAPWSKHTVLTAEFTDIPGLNPKSQNSVTIAGVKVGTVTAARVSNTGTALVTLTLDGTYSVYQNARAVLVPVNPLDQMQVNLNPGTPSAPPLTSGEVIPLSQTEAPVQADDIFDDLDAKSQAAVTDLVSQAGVALANAPTDLTKGLAQTEQTLQTLKPVAQLLATRQQRIAQLVTALSQISQAVGGNKTRITQLAAATQQTLGVLSSQHQQLEAAVAQLPDLFTQLRGSMSGVTGLTTQLNPTLDDLNAASSVLPGALSKFQTTVNALGQTVRAAKPVMSIAPSVIADLRPTVANAKTALGDLVSVGSQFDNDTRTVMSYMAAIQAFVYNTSSVFGAGDSNGSIIRGNLIVPLPGAGVLPNSLTQGK
jgi:phospholipid/cholesterol/gamma-HCH transport system substrate-binding protein